jgi:hypothetical protein
VQGRGMAVTSTWHGQKLTARRRMMVPRMVKTRPPRNPRTRPPGPETEDSPPRSGAFPPTPSTPEPPAGAGDSPRLRLSGSSRFLPVPSGAFRCLSGAPQRPCMPGPHLARSFPDCWEPGLRASSAVPERDLIRHTPGEFPSPPGDNAEGGGAGRLRIARNSALHRRAFARSAVAEPPAHPLQSCRDLPPPRVEVVAAAAEDDRRDPGQLLTLHLLYELERGLVVLLTDLAAGDEQ